MVTLPKDFVMTRYPGYFWNVAEKKLYSIKVTGELKPLSFFRGGTFYVRTFDPVYKISQQGVKRFLPLTYLVSLKAKSETDIEVIGVKKDS